MTENVTTERRDGVTTVELDRPDKLNALTLEMWERVGDAVDRAGRDGARAVVLTGAGDVFCSGDDIQTLADIETERDVRRLTETALDCFRTIEDAPAPVVGMANGSAFGGGFELLLACDLTVAPEGAVFALPEVSIGAVPFYGTKRLARLVGRQRSMDLTLTGREISAQRAVDWGLFARAVPPDRVESTVDDLVAAVREGSPGAVETGKAWLNASLRFPGEDDAMRTAFGYLFAGPDAHEGATAFLEDRDPEYSR